MNCEFCGNPQSEHLKYKIKDYKHWTIYLWKHPYYLGRCFVKLNRHAEDILDTTEEERNELFEISLKLRDALKDAFGADLMNYASLGNIVRHVHVHVIPRYSTAVEFEGVIFKDERWGKNHAPYDKEFDVSEKIKGKIIDEIKARLA